MSEVKRRTVFYHTVNGAVKFLDWAVVTMGKHASGLSRMVEPFMVNQRYLSGTGLRQYDATDPAIRIDYMQRLGHADELGKILSGGGGTPLHGGMLTPTQGNGDLFSPPT